MDCPPSTLKVLQSIADECRVCKTTKKRKLSFQVSIPESNIKFNNQVALDLMWLQDGERKRAALQVVEIEEG